MNLASSRALERALAFDAALRERAADRSEPFGRGVAFLTPSLPAVWDLSFLRVDRAAGADAAGLAASAERILAAAGIRHRRVVVPDEREGARLAPGFARLGWSAVRFLSMAAGTVEPPARSPRVEEVPLATLHPLRSVISREGPGGEDPDVVRQLLAAGERNAAAANARHLAVLEDGTAVSCADLYSDGRTAQIEDVGTLPERRGAGLGSAVVRAGVAAARASGHDLVFLVADADDRPRELYARLGFVPLGLAYAFTRPA